MLPASLKIPVAGSIRVDTEVNGSIVLATNQTCYLTKRLFWDGVKGYEYPSLRVFRDLIRAQRCFLDVGASIGYYSLMAARINPRVQVFAFEPMPSAYAFLVRNIALNGFEENIHAVRMALGDSSGEVEFFASRNPKAAYLKHHLGGASSMAGAEDEYAEAISVTIARLDDFVDQHAVGPVGIMKLDTEATEDRVLLGAEMTVKRDRPFIKAHNVQALIYGLALNVVGVVTSGVLVGLCLWPLGIALQLYWAYQAYQGKLVTIPIITDFVKNRGWA